MQPDPLLSRVLREQRQLSADLALEWKLNGGRFAFRTPRLNALRRVRRQRAGFHHLAPRVRPRPRGAGRPRAQGARSSARSGDSGDDEPAAAAARHRFQLPRVTETAVTRGWSS